MFTISLLADKSSESFNKGKIQETIPCQTLKELAEITTQYHWTPGIFDPKSRTRSNKTCLSSSLLVLDIDEGLSLREAKDCLNKHDLNFAIVTSRNHQSPKGQKPACDRFRVIIPLARQVTTDQEFKALFYVFQDKVISQADPACKDIARFFYAGNEIYIVKDDQPSNLDVDAWLLESNPAPSTPDPAPSTPASANPNAPRALSKATLNFLVNLAPKGERHNQHVKALFDMKQQGYSYDEARSKTKAAFELNNVAWGSEDETRVKDIYENREIKHDQRYPVLKYDKQKGISYPDKAAEENYYFLINKLGYEPQLNVLDQTVYVNGRPIDDSDYSKISIKARADGLLAGKDMIVDYVLELASRDSFNPLKDPIDYEYAKGEGAVSGSINALIDTINYDYDDLEEHIPRAEAEAQFNEWIRKWILGCVAKLYRPGSQNLVLIFKGAQGIGKSRWLGRLSPWKKGFVEDMVNPNNKDHDLRHLDKFIWHVAEMDAVTGRREASELKSFFTREYVSARGAYRRTERSGYSICNFCGSVNTDDFLTDGTGNRRYLVIPVKQLDPEHDINVARVLAEAKYRLEAGERFWLNFEEIETLEEYLQAYKTHDTVSDIAAQVQPGEKFFSAKEIFEYFDVVPRATDYRKLSAALAQKGVKNIRKLMPDGARRRGYMVDLGSETGRLSVVEGGESQ